MTDDPNAIGEYVGDGAGQPWERPYNWTPTGPPQMPDWPRAVQRYLIPGEREQVVGTRRHPILLIPAAAAVLGGLLVAITLNGVAYQAHAANPFVVHVIWIIYAAAAAWGLGKYLSWRATWYVVTNLRLIYLTGFARRRVIPLPLSRLRDLELYQGPMGRLCGYGTLKAASLETDHALAEVAFIPYVTQIYVDIWALKERGRLAKRDTEDAI